MRIPEASAQAGANAQGPGRNREPQTAPDPSPIVEAADKTERLKPGRGVGEHDAPRVVVKPLRHRAGRRIDDQPDAAQTVVHETVRHPAALEVVGAVSQHAVDVPAEDSPRAVQFGDDA